ncbi:MULTISPECIES: hypothetical protein [Cryobacterium]|uniref:hypothetical protein n=1 Tax=Cryobacterium TaxID=69578 RepID=UPI001124E6AE|nr:MULTISPECIES: hypothetical protein [Cryobacterium]
MPRVEDVWPGQAEDPNPLPFNFAIFAAVGQKSFRTVPFFTVGLYSDAPIHEHVDAASTRHIKLCRDPKARADEPHPAERFKSGLRPAIEEAQQRAQVVRGQTEELFEVVLRDEPHEKRGLQACQRVDIVEARQRLQHGVKR